jgi:hypothetical protein
LWYTTVVPTLRRLRQEYGEFKASLGYTVKPYLKKKRKSRNLHSPLLLEK